MKLKIGTYTHQCKIICDISYYIGHPLRSISINTTQNVTIDYELAGIMERLLAFLLDSLIVTVYCFVIFWLLIATNFIGEFGESTIPFLIFVFLIFPVIMSYHLVSESLFNGQSIGKKAMGIKVVRADGQQMHIGDFGMRWMFRLIDIMLSAGSVAVITIMSNEKNQRIGDLVGDTCVIKTNPRNQMSIKDLLKIQTQENYKPKYEAVVKFTEEDMLLLKNTLDRARSNPNDHYRKLLQKLAEKICAELDIKKVPKKRTEFLKKVLNDYIVLTR